MRLVRHNESKAFKSERKHRFILFAKQRKDGKSIIMGQLLQKGLNVEDGRINSNFQISNYF